MRSRQNRRKVAKNPQIAAQVETLENRMLLTPAAASLRVNEVDQEVTRSNQSLALPGLHFVSEQNRAESSHVAQIGDHSNLGTNVAQVGISGIVFGTAEYVISTTTNITVGDLDGNESTISGRDHSSVIDVQITGTGLGIFQIRSQALSNHTHVFHSDSIGTSSTTQEQRAHGRFTVIVTGSYNIKLQTQASITNLVEIDSSELSGRGIVSSAMNNLEVTSSGLSVAIFRSRESTIYEYLHTATNGSETRKNRATSNNSLIFHLGYNTESKTLSYVTDRSFSGLLETAPSRPQVRTHELAAGIKTANSGFSIGLSRTSVTEEDNTDQNNQFFWLYNNEYQNSSKLEISYSPSGSSQEKDEIFSNFDNLADQLFNLN